MATVQLRFLGDCWQSMTLAMSPQAAPTLASAAKQLRLGDEVQVSPSTAAPRLVDLCV
jgi:hypothetical protein